MSQLVPLLLRIGFAMCFIGHGAFGLLQKPDWIPFFGAFGISVTPALSLMPLVGLVDIGIGLAGLWYPLRAIFLYGAAWCVFTAALRPMVDQSFGEFLERAGNYGVPLAMLALTAGQRWFARITSPQLDQPYSDAACVARWATAALLAGHGWLAVAQKPLLIGHLSLLGIGSWVEAFGVFELLLAAACVIRPSRHLFYGIALWKIATESLFIFAGAPIFEFIERGGSMAVPIVAGLMLDVRATVPARRTAGLSVAAAIVMMFVAPAQAKQPSPLSPQLLQELQQGGLIVACRHAITSHEREDQMPPNFDDPSTQRRLSPEGEAQARKLGEDLAALQIRFGSVLASPFDRARRSADLMFGRAQIDQALSMTGGKPAELRALMTGPVPAGDNRLLMTHQGLLYRSFPSIPRGSVAEGGCVVARPGGEVLAVLKASDWAVAK
jgi:phosphohistidine phosphatase SixA